MPDDKPPTVPANRHDGHKWLNLRIFAQLWREMILGATLRPGPEKPAKPSNSEGQDTNSGGSGGSGENQG